MFLEMPPKSVQTNKLYFRTMTAEHSSNLKARDCIVSLSSSLRVFFSSGMCFVVLYSKIILEICLSVLTALVRLIVRSFNVLGCLSILLLTPYFPSYSFSAHISFLFDSFLFSLGIMFHCVIVCLKMHSRLLPVVFLCLSNATWCYWSDALLVT